MRRYNFFFSLLREHILSYTTGAVLLGVTLWMTFAIPGYLREAIDILSENPTEMGDVFQNKVILILVMAVALVFTRTGSRLFFFTPGRKVEFDLKNRLLRHLTTLQRDYFLDNPSGAIISRINNDINWVRMMVGFGLMGLANALGNLTLAPLNMYRISPRLTLYVVLPIVLAFMVLQFAVRLMRREQQTSMRAMQDLSDFTVESYNGVDVLKSFRAFGWAEARFALRSGEVRDSNIRMSRIRAFFMPLLMHLVNGLKVLLVLIGGMLVVDGGMSMGDFAAYTLYLSLLVPPLMGMAFMLFTMQRGFTGLSSLETIFSTRPGLPPVRPEAEQAMPAVLARGLEVRGLTYAYPDDPAHPMLHDVHLHVAPGEVVGVFGSIGSGKSTLVNLVNRYLTPPEGTVFLDGIDVTHISQGTLRRHLVTITQEPFLFSDTIRTNIEFATSPAVGGAAPGQGLPPGVLAEAVRAAALEEDLARLEHGVETMVGEKGITLSGGQRQRISLARGILKPCGLLVLDDVLSAVDHETERFLVDEIYRFQHAASLLIVSHRISALERASRIVVLEEGRVTATGTHAELIARDGPYRQAWQVQHENAPESTPQGTGNTPGGRT